jgi:hypothetical protein
LRDAAHEVEQEPPRRRVGIQIHGHDTKRSLFLLKRLDDPDEVWDRPGQSIQFRDNQSIALSDELEGLFQLLPFLNGRDLFDEKLFNASSLQLRYLSLETRFLVRRAGPGITNQHPSPPTLTEKVTIMRHVSKVKLKLYETPKGASEGDSYGQGPLGQPSDGPNQIWAMSGVRRREKSREPVLKGVVDDRKDESDCGRPRQ